MKLFVAIGAFILTSIFFSEFASGEEGKEAVQLPPVVVTAPPQVPERLYSEKQAQEEIDRTPGGVALVGPQKIQESLGTALQDVLTAVPGVMIQPRFGYVADESRLSIRGSGLRNNYHLRGLTLLLDGFPLNYADGFGDFEAAELLSAKRVEVYKGANALRFGVNSLGGAINLVTRTGEDDSLFETRSEGGSFGFMKHRISTGQVYGPFDLYVGLTNTNQDGYRDHSELTRRRVYSSFGYRTEGGTNLRLDLNYVRSDQDLPGSLTREQWKQNPQQRSPGAIGKDEARNSDNYRGAFTMAMPLGETQMLEWYTQLKYQYLDHPLSFAVINQNTYDWGSELRYVVTSPLLSYRNRFSVGLQYMQERQLEQWFDNVGGNHAAKTRDQMNKATTIGLYSEEQLSVTDTLDLVVGGRLQYARRAVDDAFLIDGGSSGSIDYIDMSPKFGFVWRVLPSIQIFGNANRAWEPGLLLELTSPEQIPSGDNLHLLNPQTAWQFEVGSRGSWRNWVEWDVSVYDMELWDEIRNVNVQPFPGAPFTIPRFTNIDRSRHTGVEFGTSLLLAENISGQLGLTSMNDTLRLNTAYTWSNFVFVNDPQFGDNDLPGAPEHFIWSEVRYDHPMGFWFAPNVEITPVGYFVTSENTVRSDPYTLVNLRFGYTLKPWNLDFFIEARNMTDKNYMSAVVVDDAAGNFIEPGDGRAFYAGVSYRWQ